MPMLPSGSDVTMPFASPHLSSWSLAPQGTMICFSVKFASGPMGPFLHLTALGYGHQDAYRKMREELVRWRSILDEALSGYPAIGAGDAVRDGSDDPNE